MSPNGPKLPVIQVLGIFANLMPGSWTASSSSRVVTLSSSSPSSDDKVWMEASATGWVSHDYPAASKPGASGYLGLGLAPGLPTAVKERVDRYVSDDKTMLKGAAEACERLHFICFVNENAYGDGSFGHAIQFIANSNLLKAAERARSALAGWPLGEPDIPNARQNNMLACLLKLADTMSNLTLSEAADPAGRHEAKWSVSVQKPPSWICTLNRLYATVPVPYLTKQISSSKHQTRCLLLFALLGHEPSARPMRCFADRPRH
ncbi:hypothetical protein [Bradyrhizobium brasilense]|uniref:hypothetical protein n=1 Tax=Bradyrhizobium brasilense TaxID=1419277 RepID=UPI003CC6297A